MFHAGSESGPAGAPGAVQPLDRPAAARRNEHQQGGCYAPSRPVGERKSRRAPPGPPGRTGRHPVPGGARPAEAVPRSRRRHARRFLPCQRSAVMDGGWRGPAGATPLIPGGGSPRLCRHARGLRSHADTLARSSTKRPKQKRRRWRTGSGVRLPLRSGGDAFGTPVGAFRRPLEIGVVIGCTAQAYILQTSPPAAWLWRRAYQTPYPSQEQ